MKGIAQQIVSPNYDDRPDESDISAIIIHHISLPEGNFAPDHVAQLFTNQLDPAAHPYFKEIAHLKVSAHLYIARDGTVTQFVPFEKRAWHAGESILNGRSCCNDFSIGIELAGTGDVPYEEAQYQALAKVTSHLLLCYPKITMDRIVGHSDVAPGRKSDPGPSFDWKHFRALVTQEENAL